MRPCGVTPSAWAHLCRTLGCSPECWALPMRIMVLSDIHLEVWRDAPM